MSTQNKISFESAKAHIETLDLTYIQEYMCATRYPLPRWNSKDAEHCCQLYKNFLILMKKYHGEFLVPTREIDEFWHNHILHTKQYMQDCQAIFGHYLHHVPASSTDDEEMLVAEFIKTKTYYLETFGIPLETFHNH